MRTAPWRKSLACPRVALLFSVGAGLLVLAHSLRVGPGMTPPQDASGVVRSADGRFTAVGAFLDDSTYRMAFRDAQNAPLTWEQILRAWRDEAFAGFFSKCLADTPFDSFFWECPGLNVHALAREFEFVTVRAHGFAPASPADFAGHLQQCTAPVVAFPNLGRDAMLVAPCPVGDRAAYGHLAAFVRRAPVPQQVALWQQVAATLTAIVDQQRARPVWLSTEGSGVPWLHIRMDARPKYYHHTPYQSPPQHVAAS
ncbi:hypothetical protein M885DRAFT_532454 [Pelagophyceae sp. CCMP2097]|nr:hypothetical protein M885DRAFT_532454 [Pelagophyceae sp. CCMP2097]|mmetsp:Transcript_9104/g.30088  ORF Transcript_9104/g.30088 Transcript_9104/m.30088 type:complete len:255 (-) Transcript_9104:9-773(-)